MGRRWTIAPAALLLVAAAGASAPALAAGEMGASLGPSPLIAEDWDHPAAYLANVGAIPINATVSIDGEGYRLSGPTTFTGIQPGHQVSVPLASVGKGEATVTAMVTADAPGQDRLAIKLVTHARHLSPLEEAQRSLAPYAGVVGALALVLVALAFVARRVVRRRAERR